MRSVSPKPLEWPTGLYPSFVFILSSFGREPLLGTSQLLVVLGQKRRSRRGKVGGRRLGDGLFGKDGDHLCTWDGSIATRVKSARRSSTVLFVLLSQATPPSPPRAALREWGWVFRLPR